MKLFGFLRKKQEEPKAEINIPKDKFVAEDGPEKYLNNNDQGNLEGINAIYNFLSTDFEAKGYSDAMVNPDNSYLKMNIDLLKHDCQIQIEKALSYYEDLQMDLDFHIDSRSRNGLVDIVEELKSKKKKVNEHITKVTVIETDCKNDTGLSQRMMLSYQRGFTKGLASLTNSDVLNRKL